MKRLEFDKGTLIFTGTLPKELQEHMIWDARVQAFRIMACEYSRLLKLFAGSSPHLIDHVRKDSPTPSTWKPVALRPYQIQAIDHWKLNEMRGMVCIPTGAGKTHVGIAAMSAIQRPTLVIVPTRVLMYQWVAAIKQYYRGEIGILGDGIKELCAITVATFESAYRHMWWLGNRFELLIVDEVHHFGRSVRDEVLEFSIAPYRLGLTATKPDDNQQQARLDHLVGKIVYELKVGQLVGTFLSPFRVHVIRVPLTSVEKLVYEQYYGLFRAFFDKFKRIYPEFNWQQFVQFAQQSEEGRKSLAGFYRSRKLVFCCAEKLAFLKKLLLAAPEKKTFIFTADTASALKISKTFLLPVIQTEIGRAERQWILERFGEGAITKIVSCKVLNEGVDVPDADTAVIFGGSSLGREYIQRIGRLLRPKEGKTAQIFELVADKTFEISHAMKRGGALEG